jgi:hypothetical protein
VGFGSILPALGQVNPFADDDLQPVALTVADYMALFGGKTRVRLVRSWKMSPKVVDLAFPGESRRKKFQWLSKANNRAVELYCSAIR